MSDETQGTASPPAEGTTAAPVAETQGTEQQQVTETQEKPEGEEPAEEAGEKPEGEATERKKLSGAEKAKRRQTYLLNQLAEKDRELEDLRRQASQRTEGGETEKAPREEDFNGDYFAFRDALSEFNVRKAVREENQRARETEQGTRDAEKQAQQRRERDVAHIERIEDAREVITDFDQVMAGMKGVNVRPEVIEEIVSSDKSALLSYHLAKNPSKLDELNAMSGRELAREVGRLEATLKMPAAKKQTTAPPPPTQLRGGASPGFDPATADMDTFAEHLLKDLERRSGRR